MNNPSTNGDPSGLEPCTFWPEGCGGSGGPPPTREEWEIVDSFVSQGSGTSACGGSPQDANDLALEDAYCDAFGVGGSTLDELNDLASAIDSATGPLDELTMLFVEDWYECIYQSANGDPWNANCGWAAVDLIPVGGKLDEAFAAYSGARRGGASADEAGTAARQLLTGSSSPTIDVDGRLFA